MGVARSMGNSTPSGGEVVKPSRGREVSPGRDGMDGVTGRVKLYRLPPVAGDRARVAFHEDEHLLIPDVKADDPIGVARISLFEDGNGSRCDAVVKENLLRVMGDDGIATYGGGASDVA